MQNANIPGSRKAVIVLKCGCKVDTETAIRLVQVVKGELRNCPIHGSVGVKQVETESWGK